MAKTTRKPQAVDTATEQPTPSAKGRKKRKASDQTAHSSSVKVNNTAKVAKQSSPGNARKKSPPKTSARPRLPKKVRGQTPLCHYRKFNKKLDLSKAQEDQESLAKSTTSSTD